MGCCCSAPEALPRQRKSGRGTLLLSPSDAHRLFHTRSGVVKFNVRARTGIDYLVKAGIIERTPEAIARLLFYHETADGKKCDDLNRQRIGEYLGTLGTNEESRAFHRELLVAFMALFSFQGLSVVGGLRLLLTRFRLPGEAQIIDRLMQRFADAVSDVRQPCSSCFSYLRCLKPLQYVRDNPGVGLVPDTVYSLAFASIMLNTDLHNPRIKFKMTLSQFMSNARDVGAPAAVLEDLFRDIATTPSESVVALLIEALCLTTLTSSSCTRSRS